MEIYDYVARQRGNDIPVFLTGDPHSENYYSWSPYAYVGNNPMKYTDPTGMDWWEDKNGDMVWLNKLYDEDYTKKTRGMKHHGENYRGVTIDQSSVYEENGMIKINIYYKYETHMIACSRQRE